MEEIIVMPWSSDSEWQSVRQDIFSSKNSRNYQRALRKLLLWKTRGRSLCRGLYCTELILQVVSKDVYFCDVDDVINESDLIRLYSMAVMKFVNMTADITVKGPQKSMYFRASCLELPSWLIDLRHRISHEQDFPPLESLRAAMEFALGWLETKYWNVDENFLVAAPKLNMDVVDEFVDILEFYMLNRIQNRSALKEEHLNVLKKKLSMPLFSNKECIKKIKEFLTKKDWSSQLVNIFITRYLIQAQECNISKGRISKTDKATWCVLLKMLTSPDLSTNALQCLVTQNSRIAALWVVELCIILLKNTNYIDTSIVLRTALNTPHSHTVVFLKWLLRIQSNPLKVKQQYYIFKLLSLYTGSAKINCKNAERVFTVNDLINSTEDQQKSQWSLAYGQFNWRQVPLGSTL